MKTNGICLFLIFATASAFAAPEASDRIQITKVSGPQEVKVIRGAGAKEEILGEGGNLFMGDEVQTAKQQIVALSAFDGTQWKIAPNTRLKLEARKPQKSNFFFWVLQIAQGSMWGEVPKSGDPLKEGEFRLKVHTKTAALGIRGTEYLTESDGNRSSLDVLEGMVLFGPSLDFGPGSYQEVKAGQHAEIGPDGKITVEPSKGDAAALVARYRLAANASGDSSVVVSNTGSPEECRIRGKGWKSSNGSKLGTCVD